MLLDELEMLVLKGESETLEFKKTTGQRTEAAKTVCAFLNGLGGIVIFGVSDKGMLEGQHVTNKTLQDIASELRRIEPPAFPEIQTISLASDKKVITLCVEGRRGSYTYDGRPYLRHGATTQVMPRAEYDRRVLEELHPTHRWENLPVAEGITIQDLDEDAIHQTLATAIKLGRMNLPPHSDTESILIGLNLIQKGKLLNAALALFGKSNSIYHLFPQFSIRLARFRGRDRLTDFFDSRIFWGHAFHLLRQGESYMRDYVPIGGRIVSGKMAREEYPMYPPLATREALANAICHRDYTCHGGAIALAIYDDHLEIANPGTFHFGVTPDQLTRPHPSQPWNPLIAEAFYRAGIIEQWGMGTLNIIRWCHENKNPAPKWEDRSDEIVITFLPSAFFLEKSQVTTPYTGQVTGQVTGQDKILEFCKDPKTAKEIMQLVGLKHRETFYKNYLKPMIHDKLLLMTVPDKPNSRNQHYVTNQEMIQNKMNDYNNPFDSTLMCGESTASLNRYQNDNILLE